MRFSLQPRTLTQLIATGFLLLCALLIATLLLTLRQLDGLDQSTRRIVGESVTAMRTARILTEQAGAMERNARQYRILNDPEFLQTYDERRKGFLAAGTQLQTLASGQLRTIVDDILLQERQVQEQISDPGTEIDQLFGTLTTLQRRIPAELDLWIDERLGQIRRESEHTRRLLALQGLGLTGTALLLAIVFTVLIVRPLRHIDQAIRQIGTGVAPTRPAIQGPRDIRALGERIDWLRERLEALDLQRTAFFRQVSHELKTPLAAIKESSALLCDGVVGQLNHEQKEVMRIQQDSCERLLQLINALLRFQSASFGVLEEMPRTLRLDALVREVLQNQALALRARGLQVTSELQPVEVRGHPEQLHAIVDNLLSNAIRFSSPGGTVNLTLEKTEADALLDCSDEGPGIPADERDRIFEPFYQGANTDHASCHGSGLGLAIAGEYAQAHQGEITLQPSARGAHFRLRLPLPDLEAR